MKTEIEVKFIDIDIEEMREKLRMAGAVCEHPMRLMKRALIEQPHHEDEHAFVRVRDEGDKVTLTFKRRNDPAAATIDNVKEIEVVVSDFDTTVELLAEAGWPYKTLQESKRETWKLGEVEVVIDEWPWLKPYIEIEGETEEAVKNVADTLGMDWKDVMYGHIDAVYEHEYEFLDGVRGVIDFHEVRFNAPVPSQFKLRIGSGS